MHDEQSAMHEAARDPGGAAGVRWNLADLYAGSDDPKIMQDLAQTYAGAQKFAARYRGQIGTLDAVQLANAVDALETLQTPVSRAYVFAELLFSADTANPKHGALLQSVQEQVTQIKNALLFFELEWLALEEVDALLANPALAKRRHFLEGLRRYRAHVLSESEERLLEETANTGSRAFSRLFDEILSDLRFFVTHASATQELSEEEVLSLLYEPDRNLRAAAATSLTQGLQRQQRVLTFLFNTLVQDKATKDRLRNYEYPAHERNLSNEIDAATVASLLNACEARYDLVARYYKLKAKLLGLEKLADYDRYAPIPGHTGKQNFAAAKRIVLDAYRDFSPQMASVTQKFFDEHWIDAELRPGKRGGAFCAATLPELHPYVLMNYTGQLRDVMTLAHELGHGVHQYLAREQGLFEQHTPLTTAETASVFGEMLVFRRLLREERDPQIQLALICGKLEEAFATVFRQVAMTRFEEALHTTRRREGELTTDRINELWLAANRPMFGDSVTLSNDYGWWWLYIPHFVHSPFYCYAYAFGELLVFALLHRYDEIGEAFVPQYLDLLRAGGSVAPPELLQRIGLDIRDAKFWDGGLTLLEELLTQAETLAQSLA